jgi:hypothetical protein
MGDTGAVVVVPAAPGDMAVMTANAELVRSAHPERYAVLPSGMQPRCGELMLAPPGTCSANQRLAPHPHTLHSALHRTSYDIAVRVPSVSPGLVEFRLGHVRFAHDSDRTHQSAIQFGRHDPSVLRLRCKPLVAGAAELAPPARSNRCFDKVNLFDSVRNLLVSNHYVVRDLRAG